MKSLWERAKEQNCKVAEKKSGIHAEVIDAFSDGVLYLDDGSDWISPVTEYTEEDFYIVNE